MRPTLRLRLASSLRRRWFERRLTRVPIGSRDDLIHLGTEYGGWVVPGDLIEPDWLCYSVGIGHDVSFDLELTTRYGVRVRAFDPFDVFCRQANAQAPRGSRFSAHAVALASQDGPLEMFGRQDEESGSVSAANLYGVSASFTRRGRTLASLMDEFGERQVQVLKLDIEGSEYEVVPRLDLRAAGVRVLLLELHHNASVGEAQQLLAGLREEGYVPVHRKRPTSFTLVSACTS
jgi:FkbM family methyltransferase